MATERQIRIAEEKARQLTEKQICAWCNKEKLLGEFICYSLNRASYSPVCLECYHEKDRIKRLENIRKWLMASETVDPSSCCLISTCPECNRLMHDKRKQYSLAYQVKWGKIVRSATYHNNYHGEYGACDECTKNLSNFCGIVKCDWCKKLKSSRYIFNAYMGDAEPIILDAEGKSLEGYRYELHKQMREIFPVEKICLSCNNRFMNLFRKERQCEEITKLIKQLTKEISHARKIANNG